MNIKKVFFLLLVAILATTSHAFSVENTSDDAESPYIEIVVRLKPGVFLNKKEVNKIVHNWPNNPGLGKIRFDVVSTNTIICIIDKEKDDAYKIKDRLLKRFRSIYEIEIGPEQFRREEDTLSFQEVLELYNAKKRTLSYKVRNFLDKASLHYKRRRLHKIHKEL
uniref:Uncharacterized protein n=1 Tax=Polytomella parva TaxID=51329 RepID=A0A7S0VKD5_9CHLO